VEVRPDKGNPLCRSLIIGATSKPPSRLSERKVFLQKRLASTCYLAGNPSEGVIFSQKCRSRARIWLKLGHEAPSGPQKWAEMERQISLRQAARRNPFATYHVICGVIDDLLSLSRPKFWLVHPHVDENHLRNRHSERSEESSPRVGRLLALLGVTKIGSTESSVMRD
jgi:hypothetical protein